MDTYEFAKKMRKEIIAMAELCDEELHWGGYLSSVEVLSVLYNDVMNLNESDYYSRDKFILSKGHCGLAMYIAMHIKGIITKKELCSFGKKGSRLSKLASYQKDIEIECSGGSLGLGLPLAVGMALLAKIKMYKYKVYVLVGDGEINEGSNWEALASAVKYQLDNLFIVVDNNGYQSDGACNDIMPMENLCNKAESFGCNTYDIDGHDISEIKRILSLDSNQKRPVFINANTIKGKGISFMENQNEWHHKKLCGKYLEIAKSEVNYI